jgi:hypothetical protein
LSGGVHSEIRLPKRRRGQRNSTSADAVAAVRELALIASDDLIAGLLNRDRLKTGHGNRWTRERVTSLRSHYRYGFAYLPKSSRLRCLNQSLSADPTSTHDRCRSIEREAVTGRYRSGDRSDIKGLVKQSRFVQSPFIRDKDAALNFIKRKAGSRYTLAGLSDKASAIVQLTGSGSKRAQRLRRRS